MPARTPKKELTYLIEPWAHQKKAINNASPIDQYGLFFEMGAGKTSTAINILRTWSYQEKRLLNTLILCPPIVVMQWLEEFKKHSHVANRVVPLVGSGKKRLALLEKGLASGEGKIYVSNYEMLSMEPIFNLLMCSHFDCFITDESQKLKNPKAKRTKLAIKFSDTVRKKLILTGSPILNSSMDLFSQFRVLDGGKLFGENFYEFRARYFFDKNANMPKHNYFPDWQVKPGTTEVFNEMVYRYAMRVRKEDCLDLPPLIRLKVEVELCPKQKKAYEEMKKDFLVYIEDKAAVASIALTKMLRMQQIVSGHLTLADGGTHSFKDTPREKALEEVLESIGPDHQVIIWGIFREDIKAIERVCEKLKIDYCKIVGGMSAGAREDAIKLFREGRARICIASQKAGGVGLNLTEASYSIYYSRSYSLEEDIQSEARNYRGGSSIHKKVTRIDLVTSGTVDTVILDALTNKQNIAEKVLAIKEGL